MEKSSEGEELSGRSCEGCNELPPASKLISPVRNLKNSNEPSEITNSNGEENDLLNYITNLFPQVEILQPSKNTNNEVIEILDYITDLIPRVLIVNKSSNRGRPKGSKNRQTIQQVCGKNERLDGLRRPDPNPPYYKENFKSWQFVMIMLHDPACKGKLIDWIEEELGVFKLLDPKEVSRLWGMRKSKRSNPEEESRRWGNTTRDPLGYNYFSRTLRSNYKEGYLLGSKVLPLRIIYSENYVYQFGPKAFEWWMKSYQQFDYLNS